MSDELDDSKAPLLDHLIELRRRLLWSVAALAVAFGGCVYFARQILAWLVAPMLAAGQTKVINTEVFGGFITEIKVAFFAAMMIASPVIANQIWLFVAPGLYKKERRAMLPFMMATPVLFTAGASLAYFIAVPLALKFLFGFQGNLGGVTQEALPDIGNYLRFMMQFMFGFGFAFLMPVLLMLLETVGIVTRDQLVAARRYAIVGAFAISAVLTPPDIGSQLLLAIPLCLLYELTLIATWFTQRRRKKMEEAEAEAEAV
jgi:sec-independent protein translocase protein TatC